MKNIKKNYQRIREVMLFLLFCTCTLAVFDADDYYHYGDFVLYNVTIRDESPMSLHMADWRASHPLYLDWSNGHITRDVLRQRTRSQIEELRLRTFRDFVLRQLYVGETTMTLPLYATWEAVQRVRAELFERNFENTVDFRRRELTIKI